MTSLVVDFLTGAAALTVVFNTGFTTFLATGFATDLAATLAGVLLLFAGAFTSCLLWALACG